MHYWTEHDKDMIKAFRKLVDLADQSTDYRLDFRHAIGTAHAFICEAEKDIAFQEHREEEKRQLKREWEAEERGERESRRQWIEENGGPKAFY